ncbi:MAG: endolytic transglycosylase MltG [bacterium]|nr:endolytic transglycosylase MltG [bacterium]
MKFNWKIILIAIVIVIVLGVGSAYLFFRREMNVPNESITANTLIRIKADESTDQIGADLMALGLIKNARLFFWIELLTGGGIKPGYYEITPRMSLLEIAELINSGKTKIVKVTFPEGYRVEQIGQKLNSAGIVSYANFMAAAKKDEGKLFPDTYFFDPLMTADEVIAKMLEDYTTRTAGMNVTDKDLILASIVEKEAANDTDRGIIAGIYQNRINSKMKLQSDPTIAYGRDSGAITGLTVAEIADYVFWKSAKTAEFTSVKSTYNTYLIASLPPAPICNPGLASIKAALNPSPSNYYYFLYGSDGKIHPARTQAEHSANVAKYL